MTNILVTGATGFTGEKVVRALLGPERHLVCLARASSRTTGLPLSDVEIRLGDLDDVQSLIDALADINAVVHVSNLLEEHTRNLLCACSARAVTRGVFVSSTGIFTRLDAESKADRIAGERLVMASGMTRTLIRPTMIYGTARDRNMARLIGYLKRYPAIPVFGSGESLQQPIHVEDLATAIASALTSVKTANRAYNVAGRHPLTYNDVIDTTSRALGVRRLRVHLPVPFSLRMVRLANTLSHQEILREEQVLRLNEDKAFDNAAAVADFGFAPRSFDEGIGQEVQLLATKGPAA